MKSINIFMESIKYTIFQIMKVDQKISSLFNYLLAIIYKQTKVSL